MGLSDMPQLWPGQPGLSLLIWIALIVIVLYFARKPAHSSIRAVSRLLRNALHLSSHSVLMAEERLKHRNREVLFSMGQEASERQITREFERMETVIHRDLAGFPTIYRKLDEQITRMEEDYSRTSEVPPTPDAWVRAVDAVSNIPSNGDTMVADVLNNIHESMNKAQKHAVEEYREMFHERHHLLKKLLPSWRRVNAALCEVKKSVDSLDERSKEVDSQLEKFEHICKGKSAGERMLSSSAYTQFFISTFVLLIAVGGGIVNFNLIAYPMQEMVGGSSYLAGFKTSNVAAMVIILLELAIGLFFMESARFTRLFPVIGALDDKVRERMKWITLTILVILASAESALAYMRDLMAAENQALSQSLSGVPMVMGGESFSSIPTAVQMVIGFILPFVLALAALPLESFVHSSRIVLGVLGAVILRLVAFVLRLLGNIAHHVGSAIVHGYDLIIFMPLWVEEKLINRTAETKATPVSDKPQPQPPAPAKPEPSK
ncbi:MAG: hypothetical protein HUJ29_08610 [Gammaproteobacteria bacterium]|nr:hypothetical protein [Gammaproteobacteria bacterium]